MRVAIFSAIFTREALINIAETTIANLSAFERDGRPVHPVFPAHDLASGTEVALDVQR